jgi:tRNA-splicing ligase RtcB
LDDVAVPDLKVFEKAMPRYGIAVKDQQLACALFRIAAMAAVLRCLELYSQRGLCQSPGHHAPDSQGFATVFGRSAEELGMDLVYDVTHHIAKVERYQAGLVVVHRGGSTGAFGPGSPDLPDAFEQTGQPMIYGGSMETGSYLPVRTERAMQETFGSTMRGSGRTISRAQAKKSFHGEQQQQQMRQRGIAV